MKEILSGNEAVAQGAFEAGCKVATAYPGTPSTEILENISKKFKDSIYCYWGSNEKTAFEEALGAAYAGARSLVAMKHVGLNVAADPLFSASYTGINKGFIIVSADDPSMHSSQNEQDNRLYAMHAKIPVLEPSDSQDVIDYINIGYQLSETFDTPVMLRLVTRISHSKSICEINKKRKEPDIKYSFDKDVSKYVIVPSNAYKRHAYVEQRLKNSQKWAIDNGLVKFEYNNKKVGIVVAGLAYQYVKEAFPEYSVLKVGMPYPLPIDAVKEFRKNVENMWVIEELEPIMEMQIKMQNIKVDLGKDKIPYLYEFSVERLRSIINEGKDYLEIEKQYNVELPPRPPVLCAGCPHRATFYVLNKEKATVNGDIGCYTLGFLPPLSAMHTTVCMGASITVGNGFQTVKKITNDKTKVVSVIGESTFMHSGLTGTVDATYNKLGNKIVILDNSVTAMTGHQDNPLTGKTLMGETTKVFNLRKFAEAANIEDYREVDGYKIDEIKKALDEQLEKDETTMLVVKRPCVLKKGVKWDPPLRINQDKCKFCKLCLQVGCPAIMITGEKTIEIDETQCTGCTVCQQVCPFDAIEVIKN